jgi:hypothetical protein
MYIKEDTISEYIEMINDIEEEDIKDVMYEVGIDYEEEDL